MADISVMYKAPSPSKKKKGLRIIEFCFRQLRDPLVKTRQAGRPWTTSASEFQLRLRTFLWLSPQ